MSWTDAQIELLKKLWGEGLSASQIASRLGHITRNAVIGKIHRLGLSGRATTSRHKTTRSRPKLPSQNKLKAEADKRAAKSKPRFGEIGNVPVRALYPMHTEVEPIREELVIPVSERKTIHTLVECSCRWPIGDPLSEDFHFCGMARVSGLPYCEFHARRAFQPRPRSKKQSDYEVFDQKLLPSP